MSPTPKAEAGAVARSAAPQDERELDDLLSRPTPGVLQTLARLPGDLVVLGAGGKMGPTLARMVRRGRDELGQADRVIAVSRFSDAAAEIALRATGVETHRADLLDPASVQALPEAPNVIYMAGQKFGTTEAPELTWAMNTIAPALVAQRYSKSRIVVFSTGCVYANTPIWQGGSREGDPLEPIGEYGNACVGRERLFEYYTKKSGTRLAIMRLNYAIDLRYGVLIDIARKVQQGQPLDLSTGHVNVIWQGDANAWAIQCLSHADQAPFIVNVTGPETASVRQIAARLGDLMDRPPVFVGEEAGTALLSDAARAFGHFGYPTVTLGQMIHWVAAWLQGGGRLLDKPTHFEARDGRY